MKKSYWLYARPFSNETEVRESTDSPAHVGPYCHAVDFLMPDGSKVLAPRTGTIIQVKDNSNRGGANQEFENDLNYITISHGMNEFSQLCHIGFKSAQVKEGQKVEEGQLIAYTGSTGWTYEPHLHFMVFQPTNKNQWGFESVPIRFKDGI
jgi:murein DD-endopeptidase MepM/ murein hydrolase activator NlpD